MYVLIIQLLRALYFPEFVHMGFWLDLQTILAQQAWGTVQRLVQGHAAHQWHHQGWDTNSPLYSTAYLNEYL